MALGHAADSGRPISLNFLVRRRSPGRPGQNESSHHQWSKALCEGNVDSRVGRRARRTITNGKSRRAGPQRSGMSRVVVVEDQPVLAAGLTAALVAAGDMVVVSLAGDAASGRDAIDAYRPHVVLLDLHLPDCDAAELLLYCRRRPTAPALLLMSERASDEVLRASIELGAAGFVLTTAPVPSIVASVRDARLGQRCFTNEELRDAMQTPWTPLTVTDHQIVAGLLRGRSNDELSGDLALSRKTIELHLTRLFERFRVMSRTELAIHVEREQILKLPAGSPLQARKWRGPGAVARQRHPVPGASLVGSDDRRMVRRRPSSAAPAAGDSHGDRGAGTPRRAEHGAGLGDSSGVRVRL